MSIAGDLIRGHTDAIILARLLRGDSYGYEINKVISTLSNNRFELKEATLYTAFKRLEELGYIASYWGDSGAGARRRYYTITPAGREACHRLLGEWQETKEIMDKLDPLMLTDVDSDVKGDAFEYFLKASTSTKNDLGEYFTPRHIVKTMVRLVNPQIGEKIYDPFCGTGGFLIESFRYIHNNMSRTETNMKTLSSHRILKKSCCA